MAQAEHLPIFKRAYDLCLYLEQAVRQFPRYQKYALGTELREHTWRPGRSICFVTDGPKPREVFAADFRDRIVHHLRGLPRGAARLQGHKAGSNARRGDVVRLGWRRAGPSSRAA